jgi:hypothetical protein
VTAARRPLGWTGGMGLSAMMGLVIKEMEKNIA